MTPTASSPTASTDVPIVLVDTDEGITGVGLGPHVELDTVFAAIEGEDPRGVTALYDRMLRQTFKAGHAGAVFGTIGASTRRCGTSRHRPRENRCGGCSAAATARSPRTPPAWTSA